MKLRCRARLAPQGSATYYASNIHDLNHETAWVEGVSGYGVGQWIKFTNLSRGDISTIKILNGYAKSYKAWRENARVKRLRVYSNGELVCILELQDSRSLQVFDLEYLLDLKFYSPNTITFEILDVYPGTKYQDTVISEIYFGVAIV